MKLPRSIVALVTAATSITVAVTGGSAAAAQPQILSAGGPTAVKDSYLVVLKDSPNTVTTSAQRLAKTHGGTVGSVWTHALHGFSIRTSQADALRLAEDPAVAFVTQNQTVHTTGRQSPVPSWGLDRIDQRLRSLDNSYAYPRSAGSGVHIYVIDTGIRITHNDFGSRARYGFDFIDNDTVASDCNGHGTHVAGTAAGTAYGVAKRARLVAVRVLNCSGNGTIEQVINGVNWVAANAVRPAVANMSLGTIGTNPALETAVTNAIATGINFVLAAGNRNMDACNYTPARTPRAITVGATQRNDDSRASFSNFGSCLDIFAPGVDIRSAWNTSDTATNTIDGTSMAAPHVTGLAALILSDHPTLGQQQLRNQIMKTATDALVTNPGAGSPNRLPYFHPNTQPATCVPITNGTNMTIPDGVDNWVNSRITVTGCPGNTDSISTVEVHILHGNRGDVAIQLVSPGGIVFRLKRPRVNSDNDIHRTYAVNLASWAANGTWTLRVRDRRDNGFGGTLDSWKLRF